MDHCNPQTNYQSIWLHYMNVLHCIWHSIFFLQCNQLLNLNKHSLHHNLPSKYFYTAWYIHNCDHHCIVYYKNLNCMIFLLKYRHDHLHNV